MNKGEVSEESKLKEEISEELVTKIKMFLTKHNSVEPIKKTLSSITDPLNIQFNIPRTFFPVLSKKLPNKHAQCL